MTTFAIISVVNGNKMEFPYKQRKAMKDYVCNMCKTDINKGIKYYSLDISPRLLNMFASQTPPDTRISTKVCEVCMKKHMEKTDSINENNEIEPVNEIEIKPDFNDPLAPNPNSDAVVTCIHCGDSYPEKEIKWIPEKGMWYCKNYPQCDGAGLGYDIH
ncbi:MAG: hypothetical protein WA130_06475 [Candidatus Methanoperedens sp.]